MKNVYTKTSRHRGYTLLELIVSVGIFGIVMLAATGAYLTLIKLDRQARAVNDVANNLSFAVDSMARAVRTGTAYKCNNNAGNTNCTVTPGTSFGFNDSSTPARAIVYSVSASRQVVATINGGTAIPLTDPRIHIDALEFRVRGVGTTSDTIQPQVTFNIRGSMSIGPNATTTFSIQGGATRRLLEL